MKYEEIKIGDVFRYRDYEETVISKSDKYRIITTIDSEMTSITWSEEDLHRLKPIKEELPEEGLLASNVGSLVYKLSDGSGYGFHLGRQYLYAVSKGWGFSADVYDWKPATPEQEKKFIEMLKKECENRGLFEDTKIEGHVNGGGNGLNRGIFSIEYANTTIWNRNGHIFGKGKFATPLKESTLDQVTDAVKDIADFTIEETESKLII